MEELKKDYNSTHGRSLADDAFHGPFSDNKFFNYNK